MVSKKNYLKFLRGRWNFCIAVQNCTSSENLRSYPGIKSRNNLIRGIWKYFRWQVQTRNILKHIRLDCNWQYLTVLYSNFECYQGYWKYKKSFDKWLCVSPQELLPLPYRFPFIIFYDFDHDVHLKCQRHRYPVVWQHFVVAKNRFWPRMP